MRAASTLPASKGVPSGDAEVVALARGLSVLKVVAGAGRPLSNGDLAAATGIPKATVSRLASTLVAAGHLRQDRDTERFTLGPAVLELGNLFLRNFDLRSMARPYFAALADQSGCSVHLGVRDGTDVLIIDSVHSRSAVITSRLGIGSRMALATSAAGRAYAAALPDRDRAALFESIARDSGLPGKVVRRFEQAVQADLALGYSTSFGEWHPQINALGISLTAPRGEVHAVSCGGPSHLLSAEFLTSKVAPMLLGARDAIAQNVGSFEGRQALGST